MLGRQDAEVWRDYLEDQARLQQHLAAAGGGGGGGVRAGGARVECALQGDGAARQDLGLAQTTLQAGRRSGKGYNGSVPGWIWVCVWGRSLTSSADKQSWYVKDW